MELAKYSIGIGDRFGRQGRAQLAALAMARAQGAEITPVWNKSHREHTIIGTSPADVRRAADAAVRTSGWTGAYRVDADHIGLKTVDAFLASCDFFTLDVADAIGREAPADAVRDFAASHSRLAGTHSLPGLDRPLRIDRSDIERAARTFLAAAREAGEIYRRVEGRKGRGNFVTEVSMDEAKTPQTPAEMLVILAALSDQHVPVQTVAPRFSGRFNKGVDYVGDPETFAQEFEQDVAVIAFAKDEFGLPDDLKLSLHSGSDKFSIYGPIRRVLRRHAAGIHLKTAGTTWLEEVAGLAEAGGRALELVKEAYAEAFQRIDELAAPYASVIDIRRQSLPSPAEVAGWTGDRFVAALRHNPASSLYNPDLRQLVHVAYGIAARMGDRYTEALETNAEVVSRAVTENIFSRHVKPLFL